MAMNLSKFFSLDKVEFTKDELEAPYKDREYYVLLMNDVPYGWYSSKYQALYHHRLLLSLNTPFDTGEDKLEVVKVKVSEVLKSTNFVIGR